MPSYLDHLVVTAPELDAGVHAVEKALGVSMASGGIHRGMGTHNRLLKLGEAMYLEVIAPDPDAPRPPHPRWFGLDHLPADAVPQITTWVIRTDDVHAASSDYASILGDVSPMTRGDLAWQITIRSDGALPMDGAAPTMIEWRAEPHPAQSLPDAGCSLPELRIFHPSPEQLYGLLTATGLISRPRIEWSGQDPAYLVAYIDTPAGQRTLGGPDSDL